MKRKSFNWDKHFSNAKYTEIASNSPDLSSRRFPTVYSPNREWIYLSSQDVDIETDDLNGLKSILCALSNSYKFAMEKKDYRKLSLLKIDFVEVCRLLQNLVKSPEDYGDPDSLLGSC